MPFAERLKLIKRIEELRGSQLFCYLTSVGTFSQEGWWSGQFASFAPKFRRCHKSLLNRALSAPNLGASGIISQEMDGADSIGEVARPWRVGEVVFSQS